MPVLESRRPAAVLTAAVAAMAGLTGTAAAVPPDGVPFAESSPFNQLVPANPSIAGNGGSIDRPLGLSNAEYTPAVFVSDPGDPVTTINLTSGWGPNALDGMKVRVDPRVRPSNDSDGHVTIVVPDQNLVISLYQAKAVSGGTLTATWGGMASLSGTGSNRADSGGGRESGISQLAGLITPDDVRRALAAGEDGDLGHALGLVHHAISARGHVAPAIFSGGTSSRDDALLMGQRVFLDPSVNVASLPCQGDEKGRRFCRIVARTLQRYGAITVTNSANFNGFQMTNPASWTAVGLENPWPDLVGQDRNGYYNYLASAIPWQRMRALSGPGIPGPRQPGLTTPARGSTPPPRGGPSSGTAAGVTVRRSVVRSGGRLVVKVAVTSRAPVRVKMRLRVLSGGATTLRRVVLSRSLTPGVRRLVALRANTAGGSRAVLTVWVVTPSGALGRRVFEQAIRV